MWTYLKSSIRYYANTYRSNSTNYVVWISTFAGTTIATTGLIQLPPYYTNVDDDESDNNSLLRRCWLTLNYRYNIKETMCEPFAYNPQFSSLRRHQTLQQMEKTATKELLNERYIIDWMNPVGEGSFGSVYTATNRTTKKMVAVKKISKKFTDNSAFQREIEALLHIRQSGGHPNICGLHENYDEEQYFYLVLDYISGGEMFDHLCTKGPYSEADAARLIQEAASALAYLHGIHIVHGDVKPENMMLSSQHSSDAVIKLVDFGCAQVTHRDDKSKNRRYGSDSLNKGVPRTPSYCPPEVLQAIRDNNGGRVEPSFDMWALGVILYIMLTGVHPFDLYGTATDDDIVQQVLSKKLPPIRNASNTSHLSEDAISLIEQLLQWEPEKRLTADQVLNNPWVRGDTARTNKIANSDKKLSKYKAFKSKLEAKVFADMVSVSSKQTSKNEIDGRSSLIEHAFRKLDENHKGYITLKDLQRSTKIVPVGTNSLSGEDEQLSLSGFSGLMGETLKNRYFPAGHVIYHEGEKGNAMFFLNSGAIEIYSKDGFKKRVNTHGDIFGEGALISQNGLRTASIRCLTPVHVIEVGREYFEKFLSEDYDLKLYLREMNNSRQQERANAMLEMQQCLKDFIVRKGEYIFKEGDPTGDLYLLDEGQVDVTLHGQKVFSVRRHGDLFGEHSIITERKRTVSAQCKSDLCKLFALSAKDFDSIGESLPSMKSSLKNLFNRREFQKAICLMTNRSFPETENDLKNAFHAVDINHSGKLELSNIRNAIKRLDPAYTEKDIAAILTSLDLDESGEVSWEEFKRLFGMDSGVHGS